MENLKKLREQHHLSQTELGDIINVSQQSIHKYENDITSPNIDTLISLADYFNTSIDYVVGYTDIPHKIEPVADAMLNQEEMALVINYRKLASKQRAVIHSVIDGYIELVNN